MRLSGRSDDDAPRLRASCPAGFGCQLPAAPTAQPRSINGLPIQLRPRAGTLAHIPVLRKYHPLTQSFLSLSQNSGERPLQLKPMQARLIKNPTNSDGASADQVKGKSLRARTRSFLAAPRRSNQSGRLFPTLPSLPTAWGKKMHGVM